MADAAHAMDVAMEARRHESRRLIKETTGKEVHELTRRQILTAFMHSAAGPPRMHQQDKLALIDWLERLATSRLHGASILASLKLAVEGKIA